MKSLSLSKSVLSSAYDIILNILLAFVKSFRNMMNKSGPKIDPCGTPAVSTLSPRNYDVINCLSAELINF